MPIRSSAIRLAVLLTCVSLTGIAQPRVDALQNNYSFLLPSDPNYGIARGSIFIIYGENLADTSTGLQSSTQAPFLQTTLEGVSAQVTVNGVAADVLWYYVTPTQLGGILPSATPAGDGTIVVRNNGQSSDPAPIRVVESAFGILTLDGSGRGAAAVYDTGFQFLTASNSAKPGDFIQLFGTGLGPVAADETMQTPPVDLTGIQVNVEIGGVPAAVLFRGRIFPGLDQVNVEIPQPPAGVAQQSSRFFGCNIPIQVRIGGLASNLATIPIAPSGGNCPAPSGGGGGGGGGSTSDLSISQAEIDRWVAAGVYRQGGVALTRATSYAVTDDIVNGGTSTTVTTSDTLSATFNSITGPDLAKLFTIGSTPGVPTPTAGECVVTVGIPANPVPNLVFTSLDAGPAVSADGPNGTRSAPRMTGADGSLLYSATIGAGVGADFVSPGVYRLSGTGGPQVGAFSGDINVAPDLVWTNRAQAEVVDRSQPLTVAWSGGEPTTLVSIQGTSTVINTAGAAVGGAVEQGVSTAGSFTCWANNPAGSFTIPAGVLSQIPASGRIQVGAFSMVVRGTLGIASVGTGVRMFADDIDYLTGGNQWGVSTSTEYR